MFSRIKIPTQLILNFFISALYVAICMFAIKFIIPLGETHKFLTRGLILVAASSALLGCVFFIFYIKDMDFKLTRNFDLPELKDFYLISIPMSPVIGYAFSNLEYLDAVGLIYVISITFIFTLVLSYIFPILFSYFASYKILMISGLALSFTILAMASITENPNSHLFNSQFVTQGIYLIVSFIILYLIYQFNKTIAYTLAIVFMLSGIGQNFLNYLSEEGSAKFQKSDKLNLFLKNDKNKIKDKKNVYILLYESYANTETLKHYGYDNSEQINFLENNNFKIYNGTYSSGGWSIASTSRILEVSGNLEKHGRYYLSGNAFGLDVFKENGYKTIGLFKSPYFFGSYPITWDEYYPKDNVSEIGGKTILQAIYEGYFRFDIFDDNYNYDKYLELKKKYLSLSPVEPRLFYTHNKYPGHSQDSGKCLENENQIYFEGMKKANVEMKNDINNINNIDPDSIIVLVSDHGPYLTKNCKELRGYKINEIDRYDIQDRYGAFLAIKWPKKYDHGKHNIEIIQDIFPAILSNLTNNNRLFNELKLERKFFDRFETNVGNINVFNGIIGAGKDKGKPLFENRSYELKK